MVKKIFGGAFTLVAVFCGLGLASASNAFGAVDLTTFTVDTASVDTLGLIVLTGLGIMWGLRKLIKTINRS